MTENIAIPATMHALTFCNMDMTPKLELDRPVPKPGPGEVLIKVSRAGVCSTVRGRWVLLALRHAWCRLVCGGLWEPFWL